MSCIKLVINMTTKRNKYEYTLFYTVYRNYMDSRISRFAENSENIDKTSKCTICCAFVAI